MNCLVRQFTVILVYFDEQLTTDYHMLQEKKYKSISFSFITLINFLIKQKLPNQAGIISINFATLRFYLETRFIKNSKGSSESLTQIAS